MEVALDGKPEASAHGGKLGEADGAEFGKAHAEIAEAPGDVVARGVDLGQQPSALGVGREELHDRPEVVLLLRAFDGGLAAAVVDELGALIVGEKLHGGLRVETGARRETLSRLRPSPVSSFL